LRGPNYGRLGRYTEAKKNIIKRLFFTKNKEVYGTKLNISFLFCPSKFYFPIFEPDSESDSLAELLADASGELTGVRFGALRPVERFPVAELVELAMLGGLFTIAFGGVRGVLSRLLALLLRLDRLERMLEELDRGIMVSASIPTCWSMDPATMVSSSWCRRIVPSWPVGRNR